MTNPNQTNPNQKRDEERSPSSTTAGQETSGRDANRGNSGTAGRDAGRSSIGGVRQGESASQQASPREGGNTEQALECVVNCLEQIVREIPKGSAAQLSNAQQEIQKARSMLSGSSNRSNPTPSADRSAERGSNLGTNR